MRSSDKPDPIHYKLHTVAQTWDEADRICRSEGSHLVVLNSADEFVVVRAIWNRNPNFTNADYTQYIHVGLRETTENNYVTDSGNNFNTLCSASKFYFNFNISKWLPDVAINITIC
jgi:hypothetical protein